jgi:hypothetical protein
MKQYFKGTLFRFPLRNEATARASAIIKTPQTHADVQKLLDMFKKAVHESLLFVRNVRRIEVYEVNDATISIGPQLLYEAEVMPIDPSQGDSVHIIAPSISTGMSTTYLVRCPCCHAALCCLALGT